MIRKLSPFIFFAITIFFAVVTLSNLPQFSTGLREKTFSFEFPYMACTDRDGNIVLLDDQSRRITKMTPDGTVLFTLHGRSRARHSFWEAINMDLDAEGNIYVLNAMRSPEGPYERESIIMFDRNGRFAGVLVEEHFTKEDRDAGVNLSWGSMHVEGNFVYYFFNRADHRIEYYKVPLAGGTPQKLFELTLETRILDMIGTENEDMYLITRDSRIFKLGADRKPEPLTGVKNTLPSPFSLARDDKGTLYVSDLIWQGVFSYSPETGVTPFLTSQDIIRTDLESKGVLRRKGGVLIGYLSHSSGSLSMVDQINRRVLIIGPDGQLKTTLTEGRYSTSLVVFRVLVHLSAVMAVLCLLVTVYLFYRVTLEGRLTLIVKHLLFYIPLITLFVVLISWRIYINGRERLETEVYHRLAAMAQTSANFIDGDAVERIQAPEDLKKADYALVRDQLNAVMNDRSDPWNVSLYAVIYTLKDGIFYFVCDIGAFYQVMSPQIYMLPETYRAFEKGKSGYGMVTDVGGKWLVGLAPIRNSDGVIIGVLEISSDLNLLDDVDRNFRKNIIIGVIISLAVFIVSFVVLTLYLLRSTRALLTGMKRVALREYDTELRVTSRDEIGDLTEEFNEMARLIRDYANDMQSLVEERTAELNEANETLMHQNNEMLKELKMAQRVQQQIIPDIETIPTRKELLLGANYSALESVGGDLYDVFAITPEKYGFLIADVAGHGVPAAMITMMIKVAFYTKIHRGIPPAEVCNRVNHVIYQFIGDLEYYATAYFGILDVTTGTFRYTNAGHPAALLWKEREKRIVTLEATGHFIGIFEEPMFETREVKLEPGDRMLLFTDGIIEAQNKQEEFYGYERLHAFFEKGYRLAPKEFVDKLIDDVTAFGDDHPADDDRAILYIQYQPDMEAMGQSDNGSDETGPSGTEESEASKPPLTVEARKVPAERKVPTKKKAEKKSTKKKAKKSGKKKK